MARATSDLANGLPPQSAPEILSILYRSMRHYSCEGRAVCPSCNTRRMVETAAHLVDHVFPTLPVR